jgi:hypothetical protein
LQRASYLDLHLDPRAGRCGYPTIAPQPRLSLRLRFASESLTDPIQIAAAYVAGFAKRYPVNARPAQRDNRRYGLQSI